jgi:hypothetical protein
MAREIRKSFERDEKNWLATNKKNAIYKNDNEFLDIRLYLI